MEVVSLPDLHRPRRGKHFQLMQEVLQGLAGLPQDSALKVSLGTHTAKDLRSAVARAAFSKHIDIASRSDDKNLYVWKKTPLKSRGET